MTSEVTLYWFRQDLRLHDNPALLHAAQTSQRLLPIYIHDIKHDQDTVWGFQRMGPHRRAFLRSGLDGLREGLISRQSILFEYQGDAVDVLVKLCRERNVTRIVSEEIAAPEEQAEVNSLRLAGIKVETFWQSSMLSKTTLPWQSDATPDVFTAFRQGIEKKGTRFDACAADISSLPSPPDWVNEQPGHRRIELNSGLESPNPTRAVWQDASFPYPLAGFSAKESDALSYLSSYFQSDRPARYKATRNGLSGTAYSTKFSPWLAVGALSPRRIMHSLSKYESEHGQNEGSYWIWFELLWRDHFRWLHHKYGRQLYLKQGLKANRHLANAQKTIQHRDGLQKWMTGTTGHAFVDAGMRELSATGYLSNRMRQIVASYLIHELGADWRAGAAWFESQLIDYDVYSNQGNWAYIAGVGSDPRGGRRFNPDKQAADHDPTGAYQKRWGTR